MRKSNTKKLTACSMLIAIGILAGNLIYIPIGAAKCMPVQHAINVITAVLFGPMYAVSTAFCISLGRNLLGTGTFLAFPGSMIGAFLAGIIYQKTKNNLCAAIGEVIGTGIIGALVAVPIAKLLMGTEVGALLYVVPFIISSLGGAIIGYLILKSSEVIRLSKKFN
ncbi:MAG: energy coupling factor transporter S component ThiW [Anaerotignaceae bacterium]